jgi:hypothetical protein
MKNQRDVVGARGDDRLNDFAQSGAPDFDSW